MSRLSCPSRATRTAPSRVPPPPPPLRGRQPHRWPLLLHAATATAQYVPPPPRYSRLQPFATTRPTRVPPAFRAPPPRTHAPLRLDGLPPPTSFPHAWTPPTARPHPIPTYGDAPQPTPSSPMHPILHGPIRGAWPPMKRLATPPRVSLPYHAYQGATMRLIPPLHVSSPHYMSRPATTHVGPPPPVLPPPPPVPAPNHASGCPAGPHHASRAAAHPSLAPFVRPGPLLPPDTIPSPGSTSPLRCMAGSRCNDVLCMKGGENNVEALNGNSEEWEEATTRFRGQGAGSPART